MEGVFYRKFWLARGGAVSPRPAVLDSRGRGETRLLQCVVHVRAVCHGGAAVLLHRAARGTATRCAAILISCLEKVGGALSCARLGA